MIYFDIFTTDTHIEYHVSAIKEDVRQRQSMSRRITIDNPEAGQRVVEWLNDAEFHQCKRTYSKAR